MELPAVNLKAILLVHWLLTTWGCIVFQGSYAWANFTILALGVWAVAQRDSVDAISMFLGGLVATVFLDIVHISIFYPTAGLTDTGRFGAGMAILSLLLKPFSCCLVYHMYRERGGFLRSSQERSAYQTIDSPEAPTEPFASLEGRGHASQGRKQQLMTSWACPAPSSGLAEAPAEEGTVQCGRWVSVSLNQTTQILFESCPAAGWLCALGQLNLSDLSVFWKRSNACQS
ncbi:type-1 angiotensin II receptor-associated protein isoform X4 [Equus asinus]|uniref:Angiotensin II receptor associated protein n=1 Tax=Equus asinus TaxID=9793 RepID=A0A9L0JQM9_EQUAS